MSAVRVVLVGGGHTNTQVVRGIHRKTLPPNVTVTLVSDNSFTYYSGMLPGCVAGIYEDEEEAKINLAQLCKLRGWQFVEGRVTRIDCDRRRVIYTSEVDAHGLELSYDILAVDAGSVTKGCSSIEGLEQYALATRPISLLMPRLRLAEQRLVQKGTSCPRVVVAGGGAAGCELCFALKARFSRRFGAADVTLIEAGTVLLHHEHAALSRTIAQQLRERSIRTVPSTRVTRVLEDRVELSDGEELPCDIVVFATGAGAPPFIARSPGLAIDEDGFLLVNEHLQSVSHPEIFGAGDCISMANQPKGFPSKAGVYAVRQGPILTSNIRRCIEHAADAHRGDRGRWPLCQRHLEQQQEIKECCCPRLASYQPQSDFLALLNLGDGRAVGCKWGIAFHGRWVWHLKNWIDRSWMRLFSREALALECEHEGALEGEEGSD